MKANMQKLEDEKIFKSCGFTENHDQNWLRTHIKFIRAGDKFRICDEEFLAIVDPFWLEPKIVKPTVENIARGVYDPRNPPIEQPGGWSIKFIKG